MALLMPFNTLCAHFFEFHGGAKRPNVSLQKKDPGENTGNFLDA